AEAGQGLRLAVLADLDTHQRRGSGRPQYRDGPRRQLALDVDVPGEACARELHDQLGGESRGRLGQVRVDTLLPSVRALGAEAEPLGGLKNPHRLEVGRL